MKEYTLEMHRKAEELSDLERQYSLVLAEKAGLEAAQAAAEEVKAARAKLQEIAPDIERDKELLKERARIDEAGQLARRRMLLQDDRRRREATISRKAEIEAARAALADLAPR